MPPFGPISRTDLIAALHRWGFEGPFSGGRHQIMVKGTIRFVLPNPHVGEIGKDLLSRLLKEAGISRKGWEKL